MADQSRDWRESQPMLAPRFTSYYDPSGSRLA
jgi:hypothetical protein